MEFRIAKDELCRALSRVQGIVEKRSTNPIIANVLLEVSAEGLRVSATDTEISFVSTYRVECKREGSLTLGARQLYDIARLLPTEAVEMRLPEGSDRMELSSGKAIFHLMGLSADDFPPVPDPGEPGGAEMQSADLRSLIDHTLFAISSDDTRTGLNGAHVEVAEGDKGTLLRFIATDGHRLSLCGRPYSGTYGAPRSVLLPKKGLSELRKLCDEGGAPWNISISEVQAVFRRGSMAFSMRLLEGEFPDYHKVIPSGWQRRALLQRDTLVQGLRRVSILSSEKTFPVRFKISGGKLILAASQPEMGDAEEELEAQVEGDDLDIGFNARYFLDALAVINVDTVAIEIGDSLSPCLLRPNEGDSDELFVVMPMRLE